MVVGAVSDCTKFTSHRLLHRLQLRSIVNFVIGFLLGTLVNTEPYSVKIVTQSAICVTRSAPACTGGRGIAVIPPPCHWCWCKHSHGLACMPVLTRRSRPGTAAAVVAVAAAPAAATVHLDSHLIPACKLEDKTIYGRPTSRSRSGSSHAREAILPSHQGGLRSEAGRRA